MKTSHNDHVEQLERENRKLRKINSALMSRIERATDQPPNSFGLFEVAITLESQVRQRTLELRAALRSIERANKALTKAKLKAEQANAFKSTFLAFVSHDLLQPLNAAKLSLSALSEHETTPSNAGLVLQVHNALVSLEELLRTLLDISKLDAGVLRPDIRTFPIDDVLEPLRVELEPLAAARGLKLRMRRSQDYVRSDPLLLRRILQNLVNNALRYARRGGVLVGCRRRGALLRIEVNDTGPGIAADRREAIWEEFQRGGSLSGEQGGFGLGLSIVRRLAAALDHPVDLASRVGYGSTFSISVPIDVASPADAAGRSENPAPRVGGLDGAEILLVENDQAVAEAMQALLGRWGCGVTIANSGAQALGTIHDLARRPDLIIADLHLDNDENGFDVVRKIQSETSGIVPAFIVTADHSQSVGATAAEIGVEVLRKPIKPAELRALMSHLLA